MDGFYDLLATRRQGQFSAMTMQELFKEFKRKELPPEIRLDQRLPSLADHLAIQSWVIRTLAEKLRVAFVNVGLHPADAQRNVQLFKKMSLKHEY